MDEVPELERRMSDFRVTLQAQKAGFRSLVYFPPHMSLRVAAALGLCILSHATMEYPLIADWVELTWKQEKVCTVVGYLRDNVHEDGSHNRSAEFWKGLGTCVLGVTTEVCRQHKLPPPRQDFNLNCNDLTLRLICLHFSINLLLLRAEGERFTMEFIRNERETGMCLVLAEEEGGVLFLNHQLMWDSDPWNRMGFPFFLQPQDKMPELPGFWDGYSQYTATISSASNIIDTAVTLIQQIYSSEKQLPLDLLTQLRDYKETLESRNLPCSENLLRLLMSANKHDVLKCSEHPGDLYTLPDCGHNFHLVCLHDHMQITGNAVCPFCGTQLSLAVLSLIYPRSYSNQAEPPPPQCSMCGREIDFRESIYHNSEGSPPHMVCLWCIDQQPTCPVCHFPLSPQDALWTMQATSLMRR